MGNKQETNNKHVEKVEKPGSLQNKNSVEIDQRNDPIIVESDTLNRMKRSLKILQSKGFFSLSFVWID